MSDRLAVLELIESGQIEVEEGVRRLEALGSAPARAAGEGEVAPGGKDPVVETARTSAPGATGTAVRPGYVLVVWQVVFNSGVAALAGGSVLLANAYAREGTRGLAWAWLVSTAGLLMMASGWWLKEARWFTLRIREHSGRRFGISLSLPLAPVVWLLRVVTPLIPQLRRASFDELNLAVRDELRQGRPFAVQVDEGNGGDRVEIHFA